MRGLLARLPEALPDAKGAALMRTHGEIYDSNPFIHLVTDDAPFPLKRDVLAWTHRVEALERAQDALARAGETFAESHLVLRERRDHAMALRDLQRVSRIDWLLEHARAFHTEHLAMDVQRAQAHLRELEMKLEKLVMHEGV
jgi:hypothetical protein